VARILIKNAEKEGITKEKQKGMVYIDADRIRELIPEYKQLLAYNDPDAGGYTQPKAGLLTRRIFYEAIERGLPIIWDAQLSPRQGFSLFLRPARNGRATRTCTG
jgi:hypothetical protein